MVHYDHTSLLSHLYSTLYCCRSCLGAEDTHGYIRYLCAEAGADVNLVQSKDQGDIKIGVEVQHFHRKRPFIESTVALGV